MLQIISPVQNYFFPFSMVDFLPFLFFNYLLSNPSKQKMYKNGLYEQCMCCHDVLNQVLFVVDSILSKVIQGRGACSKFPSVN